MAQEQIQEQRLSQQQKLTQSISQQQLLQAQLTELPIAQLIERVQTEMDDNPALEPAGAENAELAEYGESQDYSDAPDNADDPESSDALQNAEERQSALDEALQSIGRDDEELPVYQGGVSSAEDTETMVYGQERSFYDLLNEQMGMLELTDEQQTIMEYLIGSLDNDGLLRKSLPDIADELAIYHNVDASEADIEQVLQLLQDFDPAGIGGRSLQECLLLQVKRREDSRLKTLMEQVIEEYFDLFTHKHWTQLGSALQLSDIQTAALIQELRKLNPKPGASMGDVVGRSIQQITPDFIVDTQDDGTVTFSLNMADIPELRISQSFADTLSEYQNNKDHMSRQMKEALLYTKKKVDSAQGFIEAIRTRRRTLTTTMRAIIHWQHRFFEDGDEASLRPMILKDIAEQTGLDKSTISRVSNAKYAQTRWGTFPLRYFFSDSYVTADGEELSTRKIKAALRDIIEAEDKQKPLSDELLKEMLTKQGYPIARRTVAKYREQLGFPIARLRK